MESHLTLKLIFSANSIDLLTEKVLTAFQIPGVTSMGLSQQFDLQRELSRKRFYAQGRWSMVK